MSLSVSTSGLNVAQTYMNAGAHNIANANTEGFRPQQVVSSENAPSQGAKVDAVKFSNNEGVNLADELTDMKSNEKVYEANAKVVQTQNNMMGSIIDVSA